MKKKFSLKLMKKTHFLKKKSLRKDRKFSGIPQSPEISLKNQNLIKFDSESKEVTIRVFQIFLISSILNCFCFDIKIILLKDYQSMVWVTLLAGLLMIPLFLQQRLRKINKIIIDILLCATIVILYVTHLECILLPLTKNSSGLPSEKYLCYFLGTSIEILKIFLYVGRVKWLIFFLSESIMNSFLLWSLAQNWNFGFHWEISLFPVILSNVFLPLFLIYLREKEEEKNFTKRMNYEKFSRKFENLIQSTIPDPILILSSATSEILFCNDATHNVFHSKQPKEILRQLTQIQVMLEGGKTMNLLEIYNCYLNNTFAFCEKDVYQGFLIRSENNISVTQPFDSPSKHAFKKFYFNIKFIGIYWREKKEFLMLLNDTSTFFHYKKMKEVNQYKDKILATFSHDLRSPLSGIVGMLELAKEFSGIEVRLKELLQNALNSAKILNFIVNDIIDFSFFTRKELDLFQTEVKVSEAIEEVASIVEHQVKAKGLELICEIPEIAKETIVFVDISRIKQIIMNLLINAIKYTYAGFIKISISIDLNDKYAEICVSDSGIGIPKEQLKKLFELFEKNDTNEMDNNQRAGLGFGLVISQILASKLCPFRKGISVTSIVGKGSEFRFRVPTAEIRSEEKIASEREGVCSNLLNSKHKYNLITNLLSDISSQRDPGRFFNPALKPRILLVDDDMINIMVHSQYLRKFGLDFDTAYNGKEALERIKSKASEGVFYSIILMDCNMPILDGFQASENIQEIVAKSKIPKLTIVAVTANASIKDLELCKKSGMTYFLEKPVSIAKMRQLLESILQMTIDIK